jgi:hypothetical protein
MYQGGRDVIPRSCVYLPLQPCQITNSLEQSLGSLDATRGRFAAMRGRFVPGRTSWTSA